MQVRRDDIGIRALLIFPRIIGADIVLELCDPGDVDPHAVASLYRSYLRERKSWPGNP
jgi:hypothetical protein